MKTRAGKSGRVPVTALFIFLVCSLLPATGFSAEQGKGLFAGTAIVDITPKEWPLVLKGAFFPRPAKSAHDPLNVRALAFQNGEGRAVIVIVDALGLSREVIDPVKNTPKLF